MSIWEGVVRLLANGCGKGSRNHGVLDQPAALPVNRSTASRPHAGKSY